MKVLISGLYLLLATVCMGQYHPDRHNTSYNEGWIACETKDSPNAKRGDSYWIMYDFGQIYSLAKTNIWNSNVSSNTNVGIKDMAIDYSTDGVNWVEYGTVRIPEANASNFYTGVEGPDLDGIEAQYILITALSNYGGDCVGISEIRFNTNGVVSDVVDVDELEGGIKVYPNPMDQTGNIELSDIPYGKYGYQVTDLSGRVLMRENYAISQNRQTIKLDVGNLVNGIYNFTISGNGKLKSKTFEILNSK